MSGTLFNYMSGNGGSKEGEGLERLNLLACTVGQDDEIPLVIVGQQLEHSNGSSRLLLNAVAFSTLTNRSPVGTIYIPGVLVVHMIERVILTSSYVALPPNPGSA